MKAKVVYSEKYAKGTFLHLLDLKENANRAAKSELIEVGKYDNGDEYIVCRIIIKTAQSNK